MSSFVQFFHGQRTSTFLNNPQVFSSLTRRFQILSFVRHVNKSPQLNPQTNTNSPPRFFPKSPHLATKKPAFFSPLFWAVFGSFWAVFFKKSPLTFPTFPFSGNSCVRPSKFRFSGLSALHPTSNHDRQFQRNLGQFHTLCSVEERGISSPGIPFFYAYIYQRKPLSATPIFLRPALNPGASQDQKWHLQPCLGGLLV